MIDLRNIETFFWVATLGGFRAAAEKLSATQPAISQRIASLESDLGVKLFERDVRGISLTAKGRELLSHAERMLQLRGDLRRRRSLLVIADAVNGDHRNLRLAHVASIVQLDATHDANFCRW